MGLKVHICHTGSLDANLLKIKVDLERLGCIYHPPRDWKSLVGLDCISFCNGEFLRELPQIKKYIRTATFVNCMTWNFPAEIEMQRQGFIDFHLYQTQHAFDRVSKKLTPLGKYHPIIFKPYFHAEYFPYNGNRPSDTWRFGRISRNDADKFGSRQLWIYETMTAPVLKEGLILGWDDKVERKFGRKPDSYIQTLPVGSIPQTEFYRVCDAVIMTTDTFENLPRVGFEAMASGTVLVVDNKGGWKLQVDDGTTGWLCNDDREFVYKASRLAFEKNEREAMRHAAREKLIKGWGFDTAADSWEQVFKAISDQGT